MMKAMPYVLLLPVALIALLTQCEKEPIVNIPDENFLNALIDLGVDKNGDGTINPSEAEEILTLNVSSYGISDLTGIEAFVNLETLYIYYSRLSHLDVSFNTALKNIGCGSNQLSSLDVSNNPVLEVLDCPNNQISDLDVTNNTALIALGCSDNQLSNIDITHNRALEVLWCMNNQL